MPVKWEDDLEQPVAKCLRCLAIRNQLLVYGYEGYSNPISAGPTFPRRRWFTQRWFQRCTSCGAKWECDEPDGTHLMWAFQHAGVWMTKSNDEPLGTIRFDGKRCVRVLDGE